MGLVEKTVMVPEGSTALLDLVVEIVKDVKAKQYTDILDDVLQAVKKYETFSDLQADLKAPELATAIAIALAEIVMIFRAKKVEAAAQLAAGAGEEAKA